MWGKALACWISLGFAVGVWAGHPFIANWWGVLIAVQTVGRDVVAWCFTIAAFGPYVAIISGSLAFRIAMTGFAMFVWSSVLFASILNGDVARPATFVSVACIAAFLNAEYHLAKRVHAGGPDEYG